MHYGSIEHELLCKAICAGMFAFLIVLAIIVNVVTINAASRETTNESSAVYTTLAVEEDSSSIIDDAQSINSSADPVPEEPAYYTAALRSSIVRDDIEPVKDEEEDIINAEYYDTSENSVIDNDREITAYSECDPPEEVEEEDYEELLTATVEALNIRTSGDEDSDILGQLTEGDYAEILEESGDWYKVQSGDIIGWVFKSYTTTGEEAYDIILENADITATSKVDCLRVRSEPSMESTTVALLEKDDSLPVSDVEEYVDIDWVPVSYGGKTRYVYSEYVEVDTIYQYATSMEEILAERERIAAEEAKAKAEAEAKSSTASSSSSSKSSSSVSASNDDLTLLAALIYCEAGPGNGNAQIAVGAVVCNRVKSSSFPNSISGVIYQSGQFVPVGTGKLSRAISNGSYKKCLDAAQAALNGQDPTGGCLYFLSASEAQHSGTNIGGNIFFKKW